MSFPIPLRVRNFLWLVLLWTTACVEPYMPDVSDGPTSYLVVDGFINSTGTTTFKLSRTQSIKAESGVAHEKGASVFVEEKDGPRFILTEQEEGTYQGANGVIKKDKLYRLYFKTAAGKEYASEYVQVKVTPPIDALTWKTERDGVQVYVSAHDDQQDTRYYRWEFEETWQFTSAFDSKMVYQKGKLDYRKDNIYLCWRSENPATIVLGSTVKYSQDVINEAAVVRLPSTSTKLRYKYSILVRQYAQTKEAFAYWDQLKKNTQEIGSLYDPLPSRQSGNIKALANPEELVIGYVEATSAVDKRIFISRPELPQDWVAADEYKECRIGELEVAMIDLISTIGSDSETSKLRLINPLYDEFFNLSGATYQKAECVDCRFRGTNIKPVFWE